jgi:hypothetical protein
MEKTTVYKIPHLEKNPTSCSVLESSNTRLSPKPNKYTSHPYTLVLYD